VICGGSVPPLAMMLTPAAMLATIGTMLV